MTPGPVVPGGEDTAAEVEAVARALAAERRLDTARHLWMDDRAACEALLTEVLALADRWNARDGSNVGILHAAAHDLRRAVQRASGDAS